MTARQGFKTNDVSNVFAKAQLRHYSTKDTNQESDKSIKGQMASSNTDGLAKDSIMQLEEVVRQPDQEASEMKSESDLKNLSIRKGVSIEHVTNADGTKTIVINKDFESNSQATDYKKIDQKRVRTVLNKVVSDFFAE